MGYGLCRSSRFGWPVRTGGGKINKTRCEMMGMPERQEDVNDLLFDKIDKHAERINLLETFREVTMHRLDHADRRHDEVCAQLVRTETKVMAKLESQGDIINELHDENLRRDGAKNQWKVVGGVIASVYTLMQLAMLVMMALMTRGGA